MNNYFSHDSNARNSDKLLPLRMSLSVEGYGIYFMILERLREEPDYTSIKDYNMIAFDFRIGSDKVKSVIENFGLFSFTDDGNRFYSDSFSRRMLKKDEKTVKARESANVRWHLNNDKCERNAFAGKSDATKEKERKGKKRKEKESIDYVEIVTILTFSEFWELYDKKVGSKDKLCKKWDSIKEDDRDRIKEHIPIYIMSQPDKQFRKNPEAYLNNESWNDEVILKNQNGKIRSVASKSAGADAIIDAVYSASGQ